MDITYLGHSSFKIKFKSATVVTDPFDPEMVGFKFSGVEGDIVTISHDHRDHNNFSKVSGVKKVVDGPGEYEIGGVSIIGHKTFHDDKNGEERGKNTIYVIEADGLRVVHLGDLGHKLSDEIISDMGPVDVLIIPVGDAYTIGAKEAAEVANRISPYFIIPMHYKAEGINESNFEDLEPEEAFLKEIGVTVEKMPKFSLKKEDIREDQSTKVIVLERK